MEGIHGFENSYDELQEISSVSTFQLNQEQNRLNMLSYPNEFSSSQLAHVPILNKPNELSSELLDDSVPVYTQMVPAVYTQIVPTVHPFQHHPLVSSTLKRTTGFNCLNELTTNLNVSATACAGANTACAGANTACAGANTACAAANTAYEGANTACAAAYDETTVPRAWEIWPSRKFQFDKSKISELTLMILQFFDC